MQNQLHHFHIPVMGIGHSADTPIRMAPLGISSVISLVDDFLLEQLRDYYCAKFNLPFTPIEESESDGRAKRITSYLNLVQHLVSTKLEAMRKQPFFENTEKDTFFHLLPDQSPLKEDYLKLGQLSPGPDRNALASSLTSQMTAGSIDVNIMVKLDRTHTDQNGREIGVGFTDAQAALRGFAQSLLQSSVILSAGMNQRLFSYITRFRDFYRDQSGQIKKKIVLKVSDFRSALVQTKLLAKRGLEVSEYRVESGLNCGGHTFPARGQLLPSILREFRESWSTMIKNARETVAGFYEKNGWSFHGSSAADPLFTVQGGIGNAGEAKRLREEFNVDRTGWGSPFLLVPEVTNVDDTSRELLRQAKEENLYTSDVSPLGIPFNVVRGTGSEIWTAEQSQMGHPGSPCRRGYAMMNTEFSQRPICVASKQYQALKLAEINGSPISEEEKKQQSEKVVEKTCICHHLGNGILIKLGLATEKDAPPAVCPGPNIAWFNRFYTLKEMVDHIYGRGPSLVPAERPHMFAKELIMNVDFLEHMITAGPRTRSGMGAMEEFIHNIEHGISACLNIASKPAFPGENLASIRTVAHEQQARLAALSTRLFSLNLDGQEGELAVRS